MFVFLEMLLTCQCGHSDSNSLLIILFLLSYPSVTLASEHYSFFTHNAGSECVQIVAESVHVSSLKQLIDC